MKKLTPTTEAGPAPTGSAELALTVIELANLAYQHGREELSPWPEQWQKLERRILSLALWGAKGATPEIQAPTEPLTNAAVFVLLGARPAEKPDHSIVPNDRLKNLGDELKAFKARGAGIQVAPVLSDERKQGSDHPAEASNEGKAP